METHRNTRTDIADADTFAPVDDGLRSADPLDFEGYADQLEAARHKTGVDEAVVAGPARIGGIDVELALFEFGFLGGSMGEVAGERIARAIERAAERRVPFVLRTSTGGARMQEGMRSLIQMPKLVAARAELARARRPFIAVLAHPTTGGVLASIGAIADITVAEAGATIGFAGPRVAERFTGEPLPSGSHTATSAYSSGLVDELVPPSDVHAFVAGVLKTIADDDPEEVDVPPALETKPSDAWETVQLARATTRPRGPELARDSSDAFVELRGDRAGTDDPSVMCALARIAGRRCLLIAIDRDIHPGPAAYRKAIRCIEVGGRLDVPVVTLVDSRGADPSSVSEAGGVAWHIAHLFETILEAPVPVAAIVTGELGSGGSLAFAVGDEVVAYYDTIASVIGPEMAAEILWRAPTRGPDAARMLKLRASEAFDLDIVDWVVDAELNHESLRFVITDVIDRLSHLGVEDWSSARRARWRGAGG